MAKAELFQKDIPKEERIFYYTSEEDDPIKTDEQEKKVEVGLPEGYEFIPKNPFVKLYSAALFRIFKLFGQYCLFAEQRCCEVSLYNGAGIPARPFRRDQA